MSKQLYSVACEFVQLYQVRVEAEDDDEARRLAKGQFEGFGVTNDGPYGYVGQTIRAGTVIEVEPEDDTDGG